MLIKVSRTAEAVEALKQVAWAATTLQHDGSITVRLHGGSAVELNTLLVQQGFEVSALIPKQTSLEDLYMKLMEVNHGTTV